MPPLPSLARGKGATPMSAMGECRVCGEAFENEGRGRPGAMCPPCRDRECEWCGERFRSKLVRGRPIRWCSRACIDAQRAHEAGRPNRTCWGCGTRFFSEKGRNGSGRTEPRYCSRSCMWEHRAKLRGHRDRFMDHLNRVARHFDRLREATCPRCAGSFRTTNPRQVYCSDACSWRQQRSRRRARERDAYVEDVEFVDIYARDGGVCQLCHERVDRRAKYPHPRSPVLDHIVPLSRGGTHEPKNVQLAHHACNDRKGAGGMGSQLRLVG